MIPQEDPWVARTRGVEPRSQNLDNDPNESLEEQKKQTKILNSMKENQEKAAVKDDVRESQKSARANEGGINPFAYRFGGH